VKIHGEISQTRPFAVLSLYKDGFDWIYVGNEFLLIVYSIRASLLLLHLNYTSNEIIFLGDVQVI
jgi:hypothetical protein